MSQKPALEGRGPFRAENIPPGSHYELSEGHAVYFGPTGGRGSGPNLIGAAVVGFDPAVEEAGVDTGYSPEPGTLRAPDVAVGNVPDTPGWVKGAPALAIEYADVGQDEEKLADKVRDLLAMGSQWVWVVRLVGPRRVEVHVPGQGMRSFGPGEELTAPGVLKNAVRVEALFDRKAAERALLTNLLQRQGYASLDGVLERGRQEGREQGREEGREQGREEGREQGREEGREQGREEGRLAAVRSAVVRVLARRGITLGSDDRLRLERCAEVTQLERWLEAAATAERASDVFSEAGDR